MFLLILWEMSVFYKYQFYVYITYNDNFRQI